MILTLQTFVFGFFSEILHTPFWWYGAGLVKKIKQTANQFAWGMQRIGVAVWATHLLVPMYGQKDFSGRLISIFFRLAQLFFRSIVLLLFVIFLFARFVFYLLAPFIVMVFLFKTWPWQ